jgi:hypothetical protein
MASKSSEKAAAKTLTQLTGTADPLERLRLVTQLRGLVEALEHDAVELARESGATWKQIGAVNGLTKQAAQQRFRRDAPP